MTRKIITAVLVALLSVFSSFGAVSVKDFGAKGDGITLDTKAINAAILKVSEQGGGTVIVPSGKYLVHSVRLESHVHLYLEAGATIVGAEVSKAERYNLPEAGPEPQYQDFGHSHWENSLIWGVGLENVTISGQGMIDGTALGNGYRTEDLLDGLANKAIALKDCRNVTLKDFTVYRGGHFAILATNVDNLYITGLTIDTNRDGIDVDCCKNVRITACCVNAPQDDAIVLKASYALGRFRDTEDVVISGCTISGYDTGSLLDATYATPVSIYVQMKRFTDKSQHCGRIKLGTESSGGFKNISICNCTFNSCGGLLIESMDGGVVEDVVATNLTMRNCSDSPIFIRLGERMRSPEGTAVGAIRRILISDIVASYGKPNYNCIIAGTPGHKIEDITLRNIHIHSLGGLTMDSAIKTLPEVKDKYPDPWMFGESRDCAYPFSSLMLRHVDGIDIDGMSFTFEKPDGRPPFYLDDAANVHAASVRCEGKTIEVL